MFLLLYFYLIWFYLNLGLRNSYLKKILLFTIFILFISFLNLGRYLDITEEPKQADIIICLGGNDKKRVTKSLYLLKKGFSLKNKILYMGTQKALLSENSEINSLESFIFSKSFKNTYEEVRYLESILLTQKYNSVLIVSDPMHSKRIDFLIKNFTNNLKENIQYSMISTNLEWWNKNYFFLNIKSIVHSFLELNKIIYNYIKYSFLKDKHLIKKFDTKASEIKRYISKNYPY